MSNIKRILKRELVSNRKYRTTYKDIKRYFNIINKSVFNNNLAHFNDIKIKKIYKDESKKYCYGQVTVWEWKRIVRHLIYIYIYTIIITIIDYHVGNSKKFRK